MKPEGLMVDPSGRGLACYHDAPAEILGDILKLESEIIRLGNDLLAQIDKKI